MSKPRITTPEQDKALADWWWALKGMGTVRDKAPMTAPRKLTDSQIATYDAIWRNVRGYSGSKQITRLVGVRNSSTARIALQSL